MKKKKSKYKLLPHFSWGGSTPQWEKEAEAVQEAVEDDKKDYKH